jgi:hypothetical protein
MLLSTPSSIISPVMHNNIIYMQYTIYVYDTCTLYYVIKRYPVCGLVAQSAAPRSHSMNDAKCVRLPPKTAELLPSCRQCPRWGSQRNGLTAPCNHSKPPEARTVFLTVPAGPLLVRPLRFVLMRMRPTKFAFLLSISVTSFKLKLLLAAESVLNNLKYLAEVKRALQQFTEHDFGDNVHFLFVLFHFILFGSFCLFVSV